MGSKNFEVREIGGESVVWNLDTDSLEVAYQHRSNADLDLQLRTGGKERSKKKKKDDRRRRRDREEEDDE